MRFAVILRAAALVVSGALLSACPKKDSDVGPEPAATSSAPAVTSDKAGADAPAAPPKKKDDQGGW